MYVVLNLVLSRKVLQAAINKVNAPYTPEELLEMVEIKNTAKRSECFTITVTTPDRMMSAELANTLAKVLLEEYQTQRNVTVIAALKGVPQKIVLLKNELEVLHQQLEKLNKYKNTASEYADLAELNRRIIITEERFVAVYAGYLAKHEEKIRILKAQQMTMASTCPPDDNNPLGFKIGQEIEETDKYAKEFRAKLDAFVIEITGKNNDGNIKEISAGRLEELSGVASSLPNELRSYVKSIVALREKREILLRIMSKISTIEAQIEQKEAEIQRQEDYAKSLEAFLDRNDTDIMITDWAVPAN